MSRAKEFKDKDGNVLWFDYKSVATIPQLELLADLTDEPIDDLLDAGLSQKEVARRLFTLDGLVPAHVLEKRRQVREQDTPSCRWCDHYGLECEGRSSRHHFVPRWLMLELENYKSYAPRNVCTIPICLGRHRDLHLRGGSPKSIVPCLDERERKFAQRLLEELREQHPATFNLILGGSGETYEGQLIDDFVHGAFRRSVESESEEVGEVAA
jgi:hypothetical protein